MRGSAVMRCDDRSGPLDFGRATAITRVDYRRFGERLRRARLDAGLTQGEAARLLGCMQSYVSKCESGERRVDVLEFREFARLYRKPLRWFIKP